ncbi:MAG: hypothetical protein H6686_03345 [Fibrobacteria bacterium]|nr:hypothetical protein [Fibrobacteria bacterium]
MVRPGTIIGVLTGLLLLGAAGVGLWYWNEQVSPQARGSQSAGAPSGESATQLAQRVQALHDTLLLLDSRLREAQLDETEPPAELVQAQAALWERYTWARSRLSAAADAGASTASPAAVGSTAVAPSLVPAVHADPSSPPSPEAPSDQLAAMLSHLATWLWVLAGAGALLVGFLIWMLLRKPVEKAPSRPLTEPTLRMDRNVRMPVSRADEDHIPVREPTFTQMRAARGAPAVTEADDLPAAPLPETGRHAWENTVSQPQPQMAPAEPTAVQDYVVSMAKRGRTPAEIARRLRIPQDQVDLILKLRRNA